MKSDGWRRTPAAAIHRGIPKQPKGILRAANFDHSKSVTLSVMAQRSSRPPGEEIIIDIGKGLRRRLVFRADRQDPIVTDGLTAFGLLCLKHSRHAAYT